MGLVSWAVSKLSPRSPHPLHERRLRAATQAAIDIWPEVSFPFGGGISRQPSSAILLAESLGVPDAATRAIANRISGLEPQVYVEREDPDNPGTMIEEILDDHPMGILLQRPHPNLALSQILRLAAQYIVTVGEAYLVKVGDSLGVPRELHPIPPTMIEPAVGNGNVIEGYQVTDANGGVTSYPANVFIRAFFPDPENPWKAEGYLGPAGIEADTHKFASQHMRSHYQKDATPRTFLEAQPGADPWEKEAREAFWEQWGERFSNRGGRYAGLPAIGPVGYTMRQLAMQTGSDVTPYLEYLRDDLLMYFGVPRSVLGQVVSGDRSSAETNQWVFDRYAVKPVADLLAEAFTNQLARDYDPVLRFRFTPFVSDDKDFVLKQERQDLELKVRSINHVREDRMLDPVEWGEEPVGKTGEAPYDPDDARERANRPPPTPGGPQGMPPQGSDEDAEGDDATGEDEERAAHIRVRKRYAARRNRRRGNGRNAA